MNISMDLQHLGYGFALWLAICVFILAGGKAIQLVIAWIEEEKSLINTNWLFSLFCGYGKYRYHCEYDGYYRLSSNPDHLGKTFRSYSIDIDETIEEFRAQFIRPGEVCVEFIKRCGILFTIPFLAFTAINYLDVFISVSVLVMVLFMTRLIRRTMKKLKSHVEDKTVHNG